MWKTIAVVVVLIVASLPQIFQFVQDTVVQTPIDETTGYLGDVTHSESVAKLKGKRVLVVGGTRGIGLGTAQALAHVGAHVSIVGRSVASGDKALKTLKEYALDSATQEFKFYSADLSTVKGTLALISDLKKGVRFDDMVITAAVFPDWDNPLTTDGIEKTFAVMILGRFVILQHCFEFLNSGASIVNVLVSSSRTRLDKFPREFIEGKKAYQSLIEVLTTVAAVGEAVNLEFVSRWKDKNVTLIGTHPGFIDTELHNGQGVMTKIFANPVVHWLIGAISELESGENNVKILSSDKIHKKYTVVDPKLYARQTCSVLQNIYKNEGEWLIGYLEATVAKLS